MSPAGLLAEVILLLEKGFLTTGNVVVREQLHGGRSARIQVQHGKMLLVPQK